MNNIVFSILLILIGLFVGIIFMIILNSIKLMNASKKVQKRCKISYSGRILQRFAEWADKRQAMPFSEQCPCRII